MIEEGVSSKLSMGVRTLFQGLSGNDACTDNDFMQSLKHAVLHHRCLQ